MKSTFFECECYSPEHILRFTYDEEDKELYTSIFLCQYRNIFKRFWVAVKYVLGYKCIFGAWDCFIFKNEDIEELSKLLEKIKNAK